MSATFNPVAASRTRIAQIGVPFFIVSTIVVMVIPIPAPLVDLLIAINMTIAIVTMFTAMMVEEPLNFSVFPALLLVTTLFRLALNISTTRLILNTGDGGEVINTFGGFVVGDNIVIGLVIFLILVVIQFSVVTSGAGRVAEVSARFTLDAMPGKQMAIDADLNSGAINEVEAKMRRANVSREADFYGSMDGASKFVKGDAIASVVIVVINLIGGISVGVFQQDLSVGESVSQFSLLAVGDGLVSQIPALLISVASGIIVTRAITDHDGGLGSDLWIQLLQDRRVLAISAGTMLMIALMPGLPKPPFFILALLLGFAAIRKRPASNRPEAVAVVEATSNAEKEVGIMDSLRVEPLELAVASDMFDLVDPALGGSLLDRVQALRRKVAMELGLVVPLVRISDDVALPRSTYVIRVNGVEAGRGEAPPGHSLVLLPDDAAGATIVTDPVFGMPARWVPDALAEEARLAAKTVIDRPSVLVTHLSEIARRRAGDLLTRQSVQELVDTIAIRSPSVANEVGTDRLSLSDLHGILRGLLAESVPIRDLTRILEATTSRLSAPGDIEAMIEEARSSLGAVITAQISEGGVIRPITIDPLLEQRLLDSRRVGETGTHLNLDAGTIEQFAVAAEEAMTNAERQGHVPVVLCTAGLRPVVSRLLRASRRDVHVVSYSELKDGPVVEPIGVINVNEHQTV